MNIAEYFHTLVNQGDPVYVDGGPRRSSCRRRRSTAAAPRPRRRPSRVRAAGGDRADRAGDDPGTGGGPATAPAT